MKKLLIAAMTAALLAGSVTVSAAPLRSDAAVQTVPGYHKITPQQAKYLMDQGGVVVLDVREPDEFAAGHIRGAVNVPLSTLAPGARIAAVPKLDSKVLVYCRSGVRAEKASLLLVSSGYKDVSNFLGIQQWPYGLVK